MIKSAKNGNMTMFFHKGFQFEFYLYNYSTVLCKDISIDEGVQHF